MFIFLKSLARTLILPPAGPLILAVLGLLLMWRRHRLGVPLVVVGVASLWLCATPLVAALLTGFAERYPPLDPSKRVSAQAIVILGGGSVRMAPEYGGYAAESETLERLNYGAFLARRTSLPILVTGSPDEARAMSATLARDLGVTARWVEGKSGDTYENALFSADILRGAGVHRIVVVTSSPHEWRAVHEFMAAGFDVVPAPVGSDVRHAWTLMDIVPGPDGMRHSTAAVYELIGEPVREVMAALHVRRQQAKN